MKKKNFGVTQPIFKLKKNHCGKPQRPYLSQLSSKERQQYFFYRKTKINNVQGVVTDISAEANSMMGRNTPPQSCCTVSAAQHNQPLSVRYSTPDK